MEKLDLRKTHAEYYKANGSVKVIDLKSLPYLSIKGVSAPEDDLFMNSIEAIYKVAYDLKKHFKANGQDFTVAKMEGQWWVESDLPFKEVPRNEWYWNILIRLPDFVKKEDVEKSVQTLVKKGLDLVNEVVYEEINEGKSVQAMHIGSYEEEEETIGKLFSFIEENGLKINGYHHEIYINDPRRTPEERLKTIIRYPVAVQ